MSATSTKRGVDLGSFHFILVRNRFDILRTVLAHRVRYGYKVGFRLSFPKTETAYAAMMAKYKRAFFPALALKYKRSRERRLIEACDLFLPSSAMLAARLYPGLGLPTLPLPAGIDPAHVATLATLIRCDDAQLSKVREQGHNRLLGAGRSYDIMAEQLHRRLITL
ncbi:MAG: hypothetical protein IE886_07535 [Campylobacterales bacterium]|nr:hypothetical protein [Campylobacterales bacterium]